MTENSLLKDLQTLGFTKNLAKVYLALFELGEGKAGEIVKKTGMHRHIVYTALTELEQKKLVSRTTENGVMRFHPLNPDFLLSEVRRKEELAGLVISELKGRRDWVNQQVIVYESKEEIAKVEYRLHDMMRPGETQYYLGLSNGWYELFDKEGIEDIVKMQKQKRFYIKGLGSSLTQNEMNYQQLASGLTEWRCLPGVGSKDTEITILRDRIFIKIFVAPYTGIEIINERLASDYKKYFDYLWDQEVVTYTGWDAVENLLLNELIPSMGPDDIEFAQGAGYDMTDDKERFARFWLSYNTARVKRGMKRRLMMYEPYRELLEQEMTLAGDVSRVITEMRYLPKEYNSPMETHIYNNKVALILWQGTPVATVYNRPEMAVSMRNQFEMLWSIAKE
jgi:hypothetical protein